MEVAVLDTIKVGISATSAARMASSPMLLAYNISRPRAWLNNYVQHKKMVGKITHQIQLGRKTMKLFTPYGTTKPTDYSD